MERYLTACGGDTRKAMTLYRYNLQISQEMFTIVSCFEVALRNAIDRKLTENLGEEWLKDSITANGVFTQPIPTVSPLPKEWRSPQNTVCLSTPFWAGYQNRAACP